jgi:type I restriction enzyme S subunit
VQANLKRYRAAVLKAACEGKLVPTEAELARQEGRTYETGAQLLDRILTGRREKWNGKGKYKEPVKLDLTNLPQLPEGWAWTRMDAVIISGPQNGIYLPKTSYGRGCPILRIDDFQEGWVRDRDELKMVSGGPEMLKVYQLRAGDLIINRVNSPSHLGKCLVVRDGLVSAVFESNMMRAALSALIHARYVEFYLRSVDGRSRLSINAKWAVNQASINQQDVKSTALPLPPFREQQRIVAEVERRLSVAEEIEAVVKANLQRATRLQQSILRQHLRQGLAQNESGCGNSIASRGDHR